MTDGRNEQSSDEIFWRRKTKFLRMTSRCRSPLKAAVKEAVDKRGGACSCRETPMLKICAFQIKPPASRADSISCRPFVAQIDCHASSKWAPIINDVSRPVGDAAHIAPRRDAERLPASQSRHEGAGRGLCRIGEAWKAGYILIGIEYEGEMASMKSRLSIPPMMPRLAFSDDAEAHSAVPELYAGLSPLIKARHDISSCSCLACGMTCENR